MSTKETGVEQDSAKKTEVTETKKKATRSKSATTTEAKTKSASTKSATSKTSASKKKKNEAESVVTAPVVEASVVAPVVATAPVPAPVAESAAAPTPAKKRTTRKKSESTTVVVEQPALAESAKAESAKAESAQAESAKKETAAPARKQSRTRKEKSAPAASAPSAPVENARPTPVVPAPAPTAEVEPLKPVEVNPPLATENQSTPESATNGDAQKSRRRGRRGRGSEARKKAAHQQASAERNGHAQVAAPAIQPQQNQSEQRKSDASKPVQPKSIQPKSIQSKPAQQQVADAPKHQDTKTPLSATPAPELPKQRWYKVDLHMHTPASNDYEDPQLSWLDWLRTVAERGLEIVAITDHNTVAGVAAIRREIEWLTRLEQQNRLTEQERTDLNAWRDLSNRVLVLPGFEFTATFGFHILGIFPPETSVRTLEQLLITLKVPVEKLDIGSTETGASADVLTAYKVIHDAGGLAIAAHANSTHGVALRDFPFGGQTKIAYTQDPNLDALEVTDLEGRGYSTARFFDGRKQEYSRRMHCIQGSDSHRVNTDPRNPKRLGIGERATEMFLDEASFAQIASLLRSTAFRNTRPAQPKDKPFDPFASAREEGASIVQSFHDAPSPRTGLQGSKLDAIIADICAFANTSGGNIYVGATPRMERISGLVKPRQVEEQIEQAMELSLTPPLDVRFETIKSNNASILRIQVPKGEDRPYCLDGNRFYVRDEGETTLAVRDEIIAMVLETMNQRTVEIAPGLESLALSSAPAPEVANATEKKSATRRGKQSERKSKNGSTATLNSTLTVPLTNGNAPSSDPDDAFYLPQMGVEIVESASRNGAHFHTIRDLRKGTIVQNVTRKGARDLWSYAIRQQETGAIKPAAIKWQGNIGLAHVERRAGKMRYDLALREGGNVRIFYGVTQDGMEGPWAAFVQEE